MKKEKGSDATNPALTELGFLQYQVSHSTQHIFPSAQKEGYYTSPYCLLTLGPDRESP